MLKNKKKKNKIWQLAIFIGEKQFWHFYFYSFFLAHSYTTQKRKIYYNNKSE